MRTSTMILLAVLGLLVVVYVVLKIQLRVFQHSGTKTPYDVKVDGRAFTAWLHLGSKLPRWLKVTGFAIEGHAWMYALLNMVRRLHVAHEFLHLVLEQVYIWRYGYVPGRALYKWRTGFEWLYQRVWRRRSTEEEARRGQGGLAEDGVEDIMIGGKIRRVECPNLMWIPTL